MKKHLIILLSLLIASTAMSQQLQSFSVVSFSERPFDTAANDERYKEYDGNGELFSIIKLASNNPDDDLRAYDFDFGLCEHRVKSVNDEVWVYIQRNAMHVTIKRAGYKTVKHELNTTVQPGKVYEMVLSAAPKVIQRQLLMFEISPADSEALITFKPEGSGEEYKPFGNGKVDAGGRSAMSLELGKYVYKIFSANYHATEGIVTLETPNEKHVEKIELRPNFANVALNAQSGVDIYINDEKKGTGSWNGKLSPGTYGIECRKDRHKSSVETITVEAGKDMTLQLQPLSPITGTLYLSTNPLGAKIVIDGKQHGETPDFVEGLLIGEHKVELTYPGYGKETLTVTIEENATAEYNIELKKSSSQKSSSSSTGVSGGHEYVDLGLPSGLKWATCNVGASKPEEYGDYFAWGETSPKSSYKKSNSVTYGKRMGDIGGNDRYDAARANRGGDWRLPTKAEFDELLNSNNCTWTWTTQNGVNGYKVTSKRNGNSIFLPAAGYRNGTSLYNEGSNGNYWSSTPDESSDYYSCSLNFYSGGHYTYWSYRYRGQSVRPVSE